MMFRSERPRRPRVLMLIENVPLARDHRLRKQAAALLASQFEVTVICRRDPGNKACVPGVRVLAYNPASSSRRSSPVSRPRLVQA